MNGSASETVAPLPQIRADDFARRFSRRAANLVWLVGAGASASAGIPTAGDMIWEFNEVSPWTSKEALNSWHIDT